jgi:hypothetical protein
MHQKGSFFYPETFPQKHGFTTHRRAHMRTCSLYRRARMRAYFSHRRALERACSQYRRALGRACQTHRRALEHACSPHRCALMRACLPHRRAPQAHLKFLLTRTNACFFSVQVHAHARLPLSHPCMWAHILPKTPLNPCTTLPYLPCPKIRNLFLCRMLRPLT